MTHGLGQGAEWKETNAGSVPLKDYETAHEDNIKAITAMKLILAVYIPTPTITIQPPQQLHSADRVTLSCDITQGGGWEYHWERNNKHIHNLINRTITFSLPEESGHYNCFGIRRGLRSYSSPDMTVSMNATIAVQPQSPVFTGENVTLTCVIEYRSDWTYKWYKGSSALESEGNIYTITAAARSDGGQYWCQGERTDRSTTSERSNEVNIQVMVLYATLTIEPQSPVFTGEKVTLKCKIDSFSGWTYKWYKGSSRTPVSEGNSFTIRGAAESHEGQYWCQGERTHRPRATQPSTKANLSVQTLPEAKLTAEPQSPLSTGGMVTLKCVIESHSNWTYKWYKDKKNNLVIEGNNFTITRATDSDEGTYWCQGVRRERPTSSQLSNSLPVGKRDSGSSLLIMGVAVAGGVAGGVVLTIIILKVVPRCCRRQTGAVSNTSSAGPGLAGRNTTDEYDGEGRHIYETTEFTEPSRPVMDTVYDKLSLSKMGMLEDPSDAGLCTLGGNASPLSSPYSLAE
ncbi:leukocyte immunoglobulin-like receptor subfamily B member 2 isoform X2 [Alosa sapidissima]|uniref:leukocyte immunoglobulin-like receptor subfamily B member 2 isoform X2 n=1 Tax=Alosa sapidissima TaxID=34773 RepID=UPI001C09E224|nr:leukocyte immunoglobulin-like receptor subfamily B member 2 isoform X2 [Alosa sapidissima]